MATNSESPRRFDLRTTIPLATETLVSLAKQPKKSWVVPALTLVTGIAFMVLMLELLVFPGPVTALAFQGGLRSRLNANYGADPVVARIHELRLTIVEDVLGMDEGIGDEPPAIARLLQDPVPTATPKVTSEPSPTQPVEEPTVAAPTTEPDVTLTPIPVPSATAQPPTAVAAVAASEYCDRLSITSMWIQGDNDVKAKIRNSGSKHVYLVHTVFSWPDMPSPAYVHDMEFDGDRYFHTHSEAGSPTIAGSDERLKRNRTRTWEADFNDEPDEGIYGSFAVTLTFDVPGQDGHCILNGSTYREPPAPTPAPTNSPEPVPTDTPLPPPTDTPLPLTDTPAPTDTPEPPTPTDPPAPTDTPAAPTNTPEPPTETPTPTV